MKRDQDRDQDSSSQQNEQHGSTNNASHVNNTNGSNVNGSAQNNQIYQEDDGYDTVTTQDKVLFSQRIKLLPTEQLGMIVLMIQNSASQAFKDLDKEKCQILVDQIDSDTFKKINQQFIYIQYIFTIRMKFKILFPFNFSLYFNS